MEPIRARPVPFCFHSFLPEPATSQRRLVFAVPERWPARYQRTASYNKLLLTAAPKTSSERSSDPTTSLRRLNTSTAGIIASPSAPSHRRHWVRGPHP